jgi:hypothetical protein
MSGDHNMHCSANQPIAWKGEMEDGRVGLGWDKIEMQEEYPFVMPLYTAPPRIKFPVALRKMWTGAEVQQWLDENVNKEKP